MQQDCEQLISTEIVIVAPVFLGTVPALSMVCRDLLKNTKRSPSNHLKCGLKRWQ